MLTNRSIKERISCAAKSIVTLKEGKVHFLPGLCKVFLLLIIRGKERKRGLQPKAGNTEATWRGKGRHAMPKQHMESFFSPSSMLRPPIVKVCWPA
jgi:hypothetical protein